MTVVKYGFEAWALQKADEIYWDIMIISPFWGYNERKVEMARPHSMDEG